MLFCTPLPAAPGGNCPPLPPSLCYATGFYQFVVKKRILYRKLKTKSRVEYKMQLVVPVGLREKVVALAHDTLLSGQRDTAKTLRS